MYVRMLGKEGAHHRGETACESGWRDDYGQRTTGVMMGYG